MNVGELKQIIANLPDHMEVHGGDGQDPYSYHCHALVYTKEHYKRDMMGHDPPEGWAPVLIINTDWR